LPLNGVDRLYRCRSVSKDQIRHYLMSGKEALKPESILALFEIAGLEKRAALPPKPQP
jgi:hypothetical protein